MNHAGTKRIETERLILREFMIGDAEPMYRNWASDKEVTMFLTWPVHPDISASEQIIDEWIKGYDDMAFYQWAIVLKEINEPIGSISVVKMDEQADIAHIGYCIGKSWWHKGITSEAFCAIIRYLFIEVGVNRIESLHDLRNPHSGDVMKKCGLKYEGILRQGAACNSGIGDVAMYSMLRSEFLTDGISK